MVETRPAPDVVGMLTGRVPRTEPCWNCKGCGWVVAPEWRDYWERNEHLDDRTAPTGPEEIRCPCCRGTGKRPTLAALEILELANMIRKETGHDAF